MSILIPTPADHNHTTEVFKRTLSSASFLCNAADSVALHKTKKAKSKSRWLYRTAMAVAACAALIVLTGCGKPEPVTLADAKRTAAGAWACPGMTAVWLDEKTVQCLKEKK